jgi:hypothetical protein
MGKPNSKLKNEQVKALAKQVNLINNANPTVSDILY